MSTPEASGSSIRRACTRAGAQRCVQRRVAHFHSSLSGPELHGTSHMREAFWHVTSSIDARCVGSVRIGQVCARHAIAQSTHPQRRVFAPRAHYRCTGTARTPIHTIHAPAGLHDDCMLLRICCARAGREREHGACPALNGAAAAPWRRTLGAGLIERILSPCALHAWTGTLIGRPVACRAGMGSHFSCVAMQRCFWSFGDKYLLR